MAVRGRVPTNPIPKVKKELRSVNRAMLTAQRRLVVGVTAYVASLERRVDALTADNVLLKKELKRFERKARPTLRGQGPNVRDVAFEVLQKSRGPQPIQKIAAAVLKMKGGREGANFVQNLGAALQRDKRFKRASRGVYGLK